MHKILLDQAMELTKAQGECWIVLKDGSIKAVNVGDMLPKGVLLVSPAEVELTPPAMASVDNPIPDDTIPSDGGEIDPSVEQELAAIQQAIQDGQDPTEIAQATASGDATSAGGIAGSGNAGSIVTERTARATISEAGFDTTHNSRDPQRLDALPGDEIAGKIEHPPVAFDQQQIISEDTPTLFALVPTAQDPDSDGINPQGYTLVSGVQSGQLTLNADGSYQYIPSPEFQSLREGETRQVSFTYIATDPSGNQSAPATVTITITGTNDTATISATPGADQGAVKEDVTLTTGGKLVATDIDNGEAVFQPQTQVKGAHGTFTIDKDGNWTYELDNNDPLVQALKEGESLPSETFVVNSADGSAQHTVTVAITGTNDIATISATPGADQGAVKEDVTLTTGGKLVATDIDNGEAVFQPQTQVKGAHGTFTIDKDGNWTYELDNNDPLVQALKEGESLPSETFVVNSADGSAQHTVTVAITGTNDIATISATPGADQGAVKEDVTLTTGGKLVATDIDNGEAVFQPQTQVKGAHGTFTIDKDGNWTYELDNNDPLVQALKEGESLPSETFVVNSADGSAQHTVTVAITGTNDIATIGVATPGADQGAVKEDVTLTTGGKLVATDIDNSEAVFQPQTQVKGAHGTFTIDKDGNWTYELDNNDPLVQALKEGESLPSETFVVNSADGSAQHTVTVAITGTNDIATISATPGADQGAVKEDVTLTTGGKLVATDIDNGEAVFQPQTQVKGAHGTFTIDKDGNWTYELDNNDPLVQALKEGESLPSETFVVNSADGSAQHTVTVAITGTNDIATISATPGADQGAVKEDVTLTTGGKLVATDIDNGEAVFQPQTQVKGAHGTFTIDKDGNWTYELDNNDPLVQALKEGESLPSETFVVNSADGSAQHTVTVAITGTNDIATIGVATPGADQGAVKEDVTLTTGGKLVATDIDNSEAVFQPQTQVKGAHGTFTIDKDGNWTYELDNNDPLVQALKEGESLPSETFVVNSADGSAQHTVTVAITGTNDIATISATPGADQGAVKEDVTLTTGGKLVATDIDNGEAVFQPQTQVKGAHGTFTIDKDGNWTYELDNNDPLVQALKEGESLPSETFVVNSADGSAQHTVTVAITGTNDIATIGVATPGADQGAVKEDVTLTTGGKLVATDIDNSEAVFQPQTQVKGAHGTFTIDKDGNWTYELDNNDPLVQALKEGESLPSETFVVNSADGSAQHTVTVAITGTNDIATISATPGADQGAVKEDVTLTTGGKLVATDIDNGEAVFQPQTQVKGAHGTFTIDKDGNWTYELDNNDPLVQALKEGESLPSETFVVNSADGSAQHTVTVAITGTNDIATIGVATPGADQGAVKEDVTLTTGGKLVATDIDNSEAVFQPQTQVKGAHGTFTIDKDGNWTYELDNNDPLVQALKEGESLPSETFVVNSADGSAQHTVTVAITGTNDIATISATPGADQGAVKEDVTLTTGGKLVATDIDNGEAVFQPQTQVKGAHGTFTIDKDGNWTYELDNNDPLVQALKEGESLPSETFVVNSADGSAQHTVTVAITGTNDIATIGVATPGADQGAVKEDVTLTTGGKLVATDIDNSEAVFQPQTQVKGAHGTFTIDKDGNWTYELDNNDPLVQALKEGESLPSETFVVNSADGSAQHTVTVAITGTNEAPDAQDDGLANNKIVTLDGQNWDTSGDIKVDYYVIDAKTGQKVADAEKSDYTGDGDHRFGVKSGIEQPGADTVQAGQIGYLDSADQSEAMSFTFQQGQVANHATIQVKNLWSDIAHGGWEPGIERGVWKAFYKGELVATGIFEGTSGGRQDVQIDASGRYFDTIEMSTIGYKDGIVDPKGSEYFITQVTADLTRFDKAYQTNETGVLSLDVLSNDSDPNGDAIAIVPGSYPDYVTLVNGKLQFDAAKYLLTLPEAERDLVAGEAKEITFEYAIRDIHGATDHANVTITLLGETQLAPAPLHVTVQEDGLAGGAHAHSEGPLPGVHDATPHDYQFATQQTGTAVSSGGKPLSYEVSSDGLTLTGFITEAGQKVNVLTAQLNPQSGTYELDLFRPLDHDAAGKDTLSLPFELDIKVGNQHTKGELVIDVIDSAPAPAHLTLTTGDMAPQSNSVVIALDMSDSMNDYVIGENNQWISRCTLAQNAIKAMFEQYDKVGTAQFKIAAHSGSPSGQVSEWLHSVAEIETFFSKIRAAGGTPYYQALDQIDSILGNDQDQRAMEGTNKQFYFLSDGAPYDFTYWTGPSDFSHSIRGRLMQGISPDEVGGEQHYQDLLTGRVAPTKAEQLLILGESMEHILDQHGNPFDSINMLAIGQSSSLEYLEPMAGKDGTAIKVEKDADIISTLTESVPGQLHGDLTESSIEGEWVESLTHDGQTYFYDQQKNGIFAHHSDSDIKVTDGSKLTLDTANGKLALNFETGQYDYQAKDVHGDGEDKFLLTLRDGDGDTAETNLDIAVQDLAGGVTAPISLRMAAAPAMTSEIVSDEDMSSQATNNEMQDELIDFSTLSLAAPQSSTLQSQPGATLVFGELLDSGDSELDGLLAQLDSGSQGAGIGDGSNPYSSLADHSMPNLNGASIQDQLFDELALHQQFVQ